MIASYVGEQHKHWDRWLLEFRFTINSAWHESKGFLPAEIALGRKLKGPMERALQKKKNTENPVYPTSDHQKLIICIVRENVERAQVKQKKYYYQKLSPKWKDPAVIKNKLGPVNYRMSFMDDPDSIDT